MLLCNEMCNTASPLGEVLRVHNTWRVIEVLLVVSNLSLGNVCPNHALLSVRDVDLTSLDLISKCLEESRAGRRRWTRHFLILLRQA